MNKQYNKLLNIIKSSWEFSHISPGKGEVYYNSKETCCALIYSATIRIHYKILPKYKNEKRPYPMYFEKEKIFRNKT